MRSTILDCHNAASLAELAAQHNATCDRFDGRTNAMRVLAHKPSAAPAAFYCYAPHTDTFDQFDTFADFSFQCIEARTFGYYNDTDNHVTYILDATFGQAFEAD